MNEHLATLLDCLDKSKRAIFVFDVSGRLVWSSQLGRMVSARISIYRSPMGLPEFQSTQPRRAGLANGAAHQNGGTPSPRPEWLARLFETRAQGSAAEAPILVLNGRQRRAELVWTAVQENGATYPTCFLFGWEELRPMLLTTLQRDFRLTDREREVCVRLLDGKTPTEIAEAIGSSTATIRVHLKRIYSKLGVSSQAAFFRLLSRLND
jgi:DNA-binding CsgD family transcriptional regulator